MGAFGGVLAGARYHIDDGLEFMFATSALATGYKDASFDDLTTTAEAGPRMNFSWGNIGFYATAAQRWIGDGLSIRHGGARLATVIDFAAEDRVSLSAPCTLDTFHFGTDASG